jgi:uncharacterized membrane protein YjjB (DUF3815 family)
MKFLIEFLIAFTSTVGFGIITNIPRRAVPVAGVTGSVAWVAYYIITSGGGSLFMGNLSAAIIIGVLGNLFAIYKRVPVNMIYIPSLVSLVPGGTIFLAMKSFVNGDLLAGQAGVIDTMTVAIALAIGFVFSEVAMRNMRARMRNR